MFGIFFTYILDNDGKYVRNFAVIFGKPVINHPQVIARFIRKYPQLAGGFSPPLVSLDDENPNIQKKKTCSKPPTDKVLVDMFVTSSPEVCSKSNFRGKFMKLINKFVTTSRQNYVISPQFLSIAISHDAACFAPVTRRDCQRSCPTSPGSNTTWTFDVAR